MLFVVFDVVDHVECHVKDDTPLDEYDGDIIVETNSLLLLGLSDFSFRLRTHQFNLAGR